MHTIGNEDRFGGISRLYGSDALDRLLNSHCVVVGLGGVGSWVAEALARSGIGELTLIELDDVCITNSNRQLHATHSTVGRPKNAVMSDRLRDINPLITVHSVENFLTKKNMPELITPAHDIVIDATDSAYLKAGLVAYCSARKIRLITIGASGGKRDPQAITVSDLAHTSSDPMLRKVRHQLYRYYHFARDKNRKFRVDAVYSTEQMRYPQEDGSVCMAKPAPGGGTKLDCANGFGSAVMVTGTFGFVAAAKAVERLLAK